MDNQELDREELFEFLLRAEGYESADPERIVPRQRGDTAPASFAQQRLWFVDCLEPGSAAYIIPAVYRLTGRLNIGALQASLSEILRRHEALRAVFAQIDDIVVQRTAPTLDPALPLIDLRELPEAERETRARALCVELASRPFDLSTGPLFRATLLRLAEQEHILVLCVHHIVSDGWSASVLNRELDVLYQAFISGIPSPLPALPIQYADYCLWQREWLQGEHLETCLRFWKDRLHGELPVLDLPGDFPRPAVQTSHGAIHSCRWQQSLADRLQEQCRQEQVTPFMLLLAAFQALLYRYTGQPDILVGVPIANRMHSQVEDLIGLFVNTLALRTDLSGNPTFRELLQRVREVALDAFEHQDMPFEKLVQALHPGRSSNRTPLFQVMFVLQNAPHADLQLTGLDVQPVEIDRGVAKYDLTLFLNYTEKELSARFEYNTDLFEPRTIHRMAEHFRMLLEGIAVNPSLRLAELPLLTPAEREMLSEWNETTVDYPGTSCVHQLFEAQVEKTPNAEAVIFNEEHLTYGQLNDRANALAVQLQYLGTGPDTVVAIGMERSADMIVALLAVLKAGSAYVPLDIDLPQKRLVGILSDTQSPILLTQARLTERFGWYKGKQICIDADWEQLETVTGNPTSAVQPDNLAYVIFTSGSTGRPKGVAVEHRQLVNYVHALSDRLGLGGPVRFGFISTPAADLGHTAIFPTLCSGGCLCVISDAHSMDPVALSKYLERYPLDALKIVPSHLQALLSGPHPEKILPRRWLVLGGEASDWDLIATVRRWMPGCAIWNHYGPTETTVGALMYRASDERGTAHARTSTVPIGRPLGNVRACILDENLQRVPVGVPGEVYIAGKGISRGYLRQPELTAKSFIPDPFAGEALPGSARLYKTGDIARYLPDGAIEFLMRVDNQVKIRGYRIELAEIEAVLAEHPNVRDALVVAQDSEAGGGRKYLVAYVLASRNGVLDTNELRQWLQVRLPDYMLPSAVLLLDAFPLNANGKIDYRRLPPAALDKNGSESNVPPGTYIERVLAAIWQSVLRTGVVGMHDNFFDLGGDSILSLLIVAKARQAGITITAQQIFQYQTIAELAVAAEHTSHLYSQEAVTGELPLTPAQRRLLELDPPDLHELSQIRVLVSHRPLAFECLQAAVDEVLIHHDGLRLRFKQVDGEWSQFVAAPGGDDPCTRIDLSGASFAERERRRAAVMAELQSSFDLERGPLVRVALLQEGESQARVIIVVHSLIVDGVSWRVLLEDLQTAYQQASRGEAILLPPKTAPLKERTEQLVSYPHTPAGQEERGFWLNQVPDAVLPLPIDFRSAAPTGDYSDRVSFSLETQETEVLLREIPSMVQAQVSEVLLVALAQSVSPWIGTKHLLIDMVGHGRTDILSPIDLSRTVGWLVAVYPIFLQLDNVDDGLETLRIIQKALARVPSGGVGYGTLRYLSDDPEIRHKLRMAPEPQLGFNYLGRLYTHPGESDLFEIDPAFIGPPRGSRLHHAHGLDVFAYVVDSQLRIDWVYQREIHKRETIEMLGQNLIEALRRLISRAHPASAPHYTPQDFPDAGLSQQELDDLLEGLDG